MDIFGFTIPFFQSKKNMDKNKIEKTEENYSDFTTPIPTTDHMYKFLAQNIHSPVYPLSLHSIYQFSIYSSIFGSVLSAIDREIFKNGIGINSTFTFECSSCHETFEKDSDGLCNKCGAKLWVPNHIDEDILSDYREQTNTVGHSFQDIMHSLEKDLDIADNAYLVARKSYDASLIKAGDFSGQVIEFLRGDPLVFKKVIDSRGIPGYEEQGQDVQEVRFCVKHRSTSTTEKKCPECKLPTLPAHFKIEPKDEKPIYYGEDEVCHVSKYHQTTSYGIPPFFSVWVKVAVLNNQDKYCLD